jgi:phosphorylase/glycogen(starch) synthase
MERTYADQRFQDELDAEMIYTTIEEEIVPKYYNRGTDNIPYEWIKSVKSCIADIASNFTTNRMLIDYEERFYNKLRDRHQLIKAGDYTMAREIAAWKRKVSAVWDQVNVLDVKQINIDKEAIYVGNSYRYEVTVDVAGLRPEDIGVELVMAKQIEQGQGVKVISTHELKVEKTEGSHVVYTLDITPERTGSYDVALRVFPKNDKLSHRMDFALVKWA